MTITQEVCHSANLARAFRRFARYRGLWRKGVPMAAAVRDPVEAMLDLAADLHRGTYAPEPPTKIQIAKADGGTRTLSVYAIRDRVAQRALLDVVQARTDPRMAESSHGYRPGRGVATALEAARRWLEAGFCWIVDTDVRHCFDSIPRYPLLRSVARAVGDPAASTCVARFLGWMSGRNTDEERGIPQGSCLAPWLCNVYLTSFDNAMSVRSIPVVRYADDLLLFSRSRTAAEGILSDARGALGELQLQLHPAKTHVVHAAEPVRFLGKLLCAVPAVSGT